MTRRWQVWIDTGGTFTDCLAIDPHGRPHRTKVLSSSALRGRVVGLTATGGGVVVDCGWDVPPSFFAGCTLEPLGVGEGRGVRSWDRARRTLRLEGSRPEWIEPGVGFEVRSPAEAPVLAARLVTRIPFGRPLPAMAMRLATTRGTNALLQRRGAPVALFITRGFADLLAIGTQQRADLFALRVVKPEPLTAATVEVGERLAADGSVIIPLDVDRLRAEAAAVLARGIEVAAVALMHAYRNASHETRVAELLRELGFTHVSCSSDLSPTIRLLPRAETAVVDATLAPVISAYVERVARHLSAGTIHVMTSAGGLVRADLFRPKDSLLSGPAGGVVGAAAAGRRSGFRRVIGFDMGGTSTDVVRYDGDFDYVFEHRLANAHLVAPALAVESVAAGGGSICRFDGQRLQVGPESAGADPGPACYGKGGPLAVTDVNLLLGRLAPERFEIPIDREAARRAATRLARAVLGTHHRDGAEEMLEGLLAIANERMADAIRRISLRRGYDPSEYTVVAFGGAGGQHACAVSRALGIATILVPGDAGLLSAVGLGHAVIERFAERQVLAPLTEVAGHLDVWFEGLAAQAAAALVREGVGGDEIVIRRRIAHLRYAGQDASLALELRPGRDPWRAFVRAYRTLYGYRPEGRPVEVESLRVVASSRPRRGARRASPPAPRPLRPHARQRLWVGAGWRQVPVWRREDLRPGDAGEGPALVVERHAATVVEGGWWWRVDRAAALILEAKEGRTTAGTGEVGGD